MILTDEQIRYHEKYLAFDPLGYPAEPEDIWDTLIFQARRNAAAEAACIAFGFYVGNSSPEYLERAIDALNEWRNIKYGA